MHRAPGRNNRGGFHPQAWNVAVTHGPDAGRRWVVQVGRTLTIGRTEVADPTISSRHLVVGEEWQDTPVGPVPMIRNLSETNPATLPPTAGGSPCPIPRAGLWATGDEARFCIGATVVTVSPVTTESAGSPGSDSQRRVAADRHRTVRIDRPPLAAQPPVPQTLDVPVAANAKQTPRLSIAGLILPVVTGAVLAILINPMLAVMAAMSPVLMLGSWVEERRRVRQDRAKGLRSTSEQLVSFQQALLNNINTYTDDLRSRHPGAAELCRFADVADLRLWERRTCHADAGMVTVGLGTRPAPHRLNRVPGTTPHSSAEAAAERLRYIDHVPVCVSLLPGQVVGILGDRQRAADLARSMLVQATVMHGPADLRVALAVDLIRAEDWSWAAKLPHAGIGCDPLMTCSADTVRTVVEDMARAPMWTILVIDGWSMLDHVAIRALVAAQREWLSVVILADRIDQVPQHAAAAIRVHERGRVLADLLQNPRTICHEPGTPFVLSGMAASRAKRVAESLSTCQDGALHDAGSALASVVRLSELLIGTESDNASASDSQRWHDHIRSAWLPSRHTHMDRLVATLGLAGTDPVTIDLVSDGPHTLIAGTTGSGKSELLRTLVCSLAAGYSPQQLTFVLIDYKGGAAFTGMEELPHTVGFVTDLDDGLGSRALICLEAELRHREQMLAAAGSEDITAYPHGQLGIPAMPRLVVVIDEFATMLAELPDFVSALIGIAQRGRSLGVHLILATQRPAGAVNDSIRANTNLRLCLRVQTAADSSDVIGSPRAAALDRRFPGRAVLRTGPEEFVAMQTASCTLRGTGPGSAGRDNQAIAFHTAAQDSSGVALGFRSPVLTGRPEPSGAADKLAGRSDLDDIVASAKLVASEMQLARPRRPWPEPLPATLALFDADNTVQLGLVDRPELQCTEVLPVSMFRSNTVMFGAAGSGVSTALASVAVALACTSDPGTLHLYLVDHGSGVFAGLEALPQVGARITATEPERLDRLARVLTSTIDQRRADREIRPDAHHPQVIVCVDDWGALRAATDDVLGAVQERWFRIFADGPSVGVTSVISADRAQALPGSALASFGTRFAFRLNDPLDDAMLGIARSSPPRSAPGRAIELSNGAAVQFATSGSSHPDSARTHASGVDLAAQHPGPRRIELLPTSISAQTVWERAADQGTTLTHRSSSESLSLPIGIGDTDLGPVGWQLHQGEHLLVTGPGRSGKSNVLALIAAAARADHQRIRIVTLGSGRSPLTATLDGLGIDHQQTYDLAEVIGAQSQPDRASGGLLLLVDDAELIDDPSGDMARFIAARNQHVWIVATGRADALRNAYGHWTVPLRRSRKGLALRPHIEMDGELWATPLPRNRVRGGARVMPVGRGYLLDDGHAELVQTGHIETGTIETIHVETGHIEPMVRRDNGTAQSLDTAKPARISPIECGSPSTTGRRIAS